MNYTPLISDKWVILSLLNIHYLLLFDARERLLALTDDVMITSCTEWAEFQ